MVVFNFSAVTPEVCVLLLPTSTLVMCEQNEKQMIDSDVKSLCLFVA